MKNRYIHRLTLGSLHIRARAAASWNREILEAVRNTKPSILVILNGDFVVPSTLRAIREQGVKIGIFHADSPFRPSPNFRPETFESVKEADCYFMWSKELCRRLIAEAGARNVHYLPFAWDDKVFPYQGTVVEKLHDVVFVGGWDRDREIFLEEVARHYPLRIWGPNYWATRTRPGSKVRACWQGLPVYGAQAAELLARSRVAINILRRQNMPDGTNMRTFEVPGCGGFVLSTRSLGATEIFQEGVSGAYFGNETECLDQVERFLTHDSHRQEIINVAHEIVAHQSYSIRAKEILTTMDAQ
jgi:spore maturation protein CgeB